MHHSDNMTSKQMMDVLEEKEGEEFDQAFLEHMMMHHKSGIEMAKLATKKASRTGVKEMAERISSQQENEVKEMKEMMS